MSKADQDSNAKERPALMPNFAWKELIVDIRVKRGFKYKYLLAEALEVCDQTISRWLSENPPSPNPESFTKVADYLKISEDDLARKWLSFMNQSYERYQHAPSGIIRESAAAYGEPDLVEQAKVLKRLDLGNVPLEQRPFLHLERREILELAAEVDDFKKRFSSRLKSMLTSFRQLHRSAVDTARQMKSIHGG